MTDSLGRSWQLGTVQLDYSFPERFDLTYTGADNAEHRVGDDPPRADGLLRALHRHPHRALAGEFPFWLAPVQAIVLPISDRHFDAAREVGAALRGAGVRGEVDDRTESVGRKIRDAELRKIPYMLVVGDREAEAGTVSVREHRVGDSGSEPVAEVVAQLAGKAARREG